MGVFRWNSGQDIPPSLDLRLQGWLLLGAEDARYCLTIVPAGDLGHADPADACAASPEVRRLTMVSGVNDADERARLLDDGFGDAIGEDVPIVELHARARRLSAARHWLPRRRIIAKLELDLLTRDALSDGQPIGLKPREFELLWRLADTPDQAVSRQALVHDVLRLSFEPASNSIAVHMSRLRGKLGGAGLDDLVETSAGGYRLRLPTGVQATWTTRLPPSASADPRLC